MAKNDRALIEAFLAEQRIAFVGVSRQPRDFSRVLFRELLGRGYTLLPVHPAAEEIEGLKVFRRVADISPAPAAALLLTPPAGSANCVEDCARAGVRMVWLYRSVALGSVTPEALAACARHGLQVIEGECPFMFLPNPGLIHALHRGWRRLAGTLPLAPPRA